MDFLRNKTNGRQPPRTADYAPLTAEEDAHAESDVQYAADEPVDDRVPFSWFEYGSITFLGMAMLWSWYVSHQYESSCWMLINFTTDTGTCSLLPLLTSHRDSKVTDGLKSIFNRPS